MAGRVIYYFLQCTWGLVLNLAGGLMWLLLHLRGARGFRYQNAAVTYWDRASSMAIGSFIFLEKDLDQEEERILYHEYGHTFQSAWLGLLYLPVIALPSLIWANSRRLERYRRRTATSYYKFYPERWADRIGTWQLRKINKTERRKNEMDYPKIPMLPINPSLEGFALLQRDIVYTSCDGRDYSLDLLEPWPAEDAAPQKYPLVVFVQGSAWTTPDRNYEIPQLGKLAAEGFVVATVGHRSCVDGYKAPAFLQDVKTAIRFLRAHAEEYRIDPERVCIWGTSSGGNTALLVGTTAGDPRFLTDEYKEYSDAVQLVVECFGPTDLNAMVTENYQAMVDDPTTIFALLCGHPFTDEVKEVMAMISPLNYVEAGKDFPPFLILHGTGDPVVDYTQSTRMYKKLLDNGYDATMYQVPGAPHEGSFWSRDLLQVIFDYIKARL